MFHVNIAELGLRYVTLYCGLEVLLASG